MNTEVMEMKVNSVIEDMEMKSVIDVGHYSQLVVTNEQFGYFIEALERAAELDYSGKRLRFDYDILETAFKILLPVTYQKTLERLQNDEMSEGDKQ